MQKFSIDQEYKEQILEELDDEVTSSIIEDQDEPEGCKSGMVSSLQAFYSNLMDDLHDSAGDQDYQQGVLERMQFMEEEFSVIITPFKDEDKLSEAPWAK